MRHAVAGQKRNLVPSREDSDLFVRLSWRRGTEYGRGPLRSGAIRSPRGQNRQTASLELRTRRAKPTPLASWACPDPRRTRAGPAPDAPRSFVSSARLPRRLAGPRSRPPGCQSGTVHRGGSTSIPLRMPTRAAPATGRSHRPTAHGNLRRRALLGCHTSETVYQPVPASAHRLLSSAWPPGGFSVRGLYCGRRRCCVLFS